MGRLSPTTYTVPEGFWRERVDKVLAHAFPEHSRSAFQRSIEKGGAYRFAKQGKS